MEKRKRFIRGVILILMTLAIFAIVDVWCSCHWLDIQEYDYKSEKLEDGQELSVAVLSDLHDHEFGKDNEQLVKKLREQNPDLILMDGDFLNSDSENTEVPCRLIKQLKEIAPVYYALGNHELEYMEAGHAGLVSQLETSGAVVLDKEYADIEMNGVALRLGGMYDYAFALDGNDDATKVSDAIGNFLEDYQNTNRLKLMMAHRPESFCFGNASAVWDVDLVISGHIHGGQVVLPLLGGLYGGDQGWFPEYVHGMYRKDDMDIFVTSGLGSHRQLLPRFNNLPEVAIINIHK